MIYTLSLHDALPISWDIRGTNALGIRVTAVLRHSTLCTQGRRRELPDDGSSRRRPGCAGSIPCGRATPCRTESLAGAQLPSTCPTRLVRGRLTQCVADSPGVAANSPVPVGSPGP